MSEAAAAMSLVFGDFLLNDNTKKDKKAPAASLSELLQNVNEDLFQTDKSSMGSMGHSFGGNRTYHI